MQHIPTFIFGDTRLPERFWAKVVVDTGSGCWVWMGARNSRGYGSVGWQGKSQLAHRVAYAQLAGAIPDGLSLDHVALRGCIHRSCVNPSHLEPVTYGENTMRRFGSHHGLCAKGHPMTYLPSGRGQCLTCRPLSERGNHALKTHCPRGHEYTTENTYLTPHKSGAIGRECKVCKKHYARFGHYPPSVVAV